MSEDDPGQLADQLDQQAGEMEKRSGKLSREIDDVDEDWQRKRADSSVPGAQPDQSGDHEDEEGEQAAGNAPQGDAAQGDSDGEQNG